MQETWVQFLGQEDPQEKGMTTHSSIPAWRIPWNEEPGGYSQWSRNKQAWTPIILTSECVFFFLRYDWRLTLF